MLSLDLFLGIGIIGMVFILTAFLLNQMNIWTKEMLIYDLCNFLGGLLLVIYAWDGRAWPFLILNVVWTLYSLKDVVRTLFR